MHQLMLLIDRPKHLPEGYNCAIDINIGGLPTTITDAMRQHVPDLIYRDRLTHERADFIMRDCLRILKGYTVKAIVIDHNKRDMQVYSFV